MSKIKIPNHKLRQLPPDVELRFVTSWSDHDLVELYKAGGWWKEHYDPSGLHALIHGSFAFVVALHKPINTAIGMGRAISDGVSDAYIQDVVVLENWRRKGIGLNIVKALLDFCLEKNLVWIGLVAEPGTQWFYKPLGFKILSGEPMVYQPEVLDV